MSSLNTFTSRLAMLALTSAALTACSTSSSDNGPTFQDYLSIQDALFAYSYGHDNHDDRLKASAFTQDGSIVMVVDGMQIVEYPNQPSKNAPMPGAPSAGGPPGGAPDGAAPAGPPGGFEQPKGELWHLAYPGHIKFESATRATHYAYWTSLYAEANGPRDSQVGSPGHYADILEKQADGRWLLVERKIVVGSKK